MSSLEYYAKRGLLGLEAHDQAQTNPQGLRDMFPQAPMPTTMAETMAGGTQVASNDSPEVNKAIIARSMGGSGTGQKITIPRQTTAEADETNARIHAALEARLKAAAAREAAAREEQEPNEQEPDADSDDK